MGMHMLQEGRIYQIYSGVCERESNVGGAKTGVKFSEATSHSIHLMGKRDEEQRDSDLSPCASSRHINLAASLLERVPTSQRKYHDEPSQNKISLKLVKNN
jgi:hypothetical protein